MNVDSKDFLDSVVQIDSAIRGLMELLRESEFPEVSNGIRHYYADMGKLPFQVASQFSRPDEFLQALLDMLRAQFEHHPLGTFFWNSNLTAILADDLESAHISFGYVSVIGGAQQSFTELWSTEVIAHMDRCNVLFEEAASVYIAIIVGSQSYTLQLVEEVVTQVETVIGVAKEDGAGWIAGRPGGASIGYAMDDGLDRRIRVSVWVIG